MLGICEMLWLQGGGSIVNGIKSYGDGFTNCGHVSLQPLQ